MTVPVITCQIMNLQLGLTNKTVRASKFPELRSILTQLEKENAKEVVREESETDTPSPIERSTQATVQPEETKTIMTIEKCPVPDPQQLSEIEPFFSGKLDSKNPNTLESMQARIWNGERIDFFCFQMSVGLLSTTNMQRAIKINL